MASRDDDAVAGQAAAPGDEPVGAREDAPAGPPLARAVPDVPRLADEDEDDLDQTTTQVTPELDPASLDVTMTASSRPKPAAAPSPRPAGTPPTKPATLPPAAGTAALATPAAMPKGPPRPLAARPRIPAAPPLRPSLPSSALASHDASALTLTVPGDVAIRELPEQDAPEDTEVRAPVQSVPPTQLPSTARSRVSDDTIVEGEAAPDSVTRQPVLAPPAAGAPPWIGARPLLPELDDDDDPKDDDAYDADESVTMRGPPRDPPGRLSGGVVSGGVISVSRRAPYEDDQDEGADDAESVTARSPKRRANVPRVFASEDGAEDAPENMTAVMPSSPYGPRGFGRPPPPTYASNTTSSSPVWISSPPAARGDSDSALRMARPASPGVEHASMGALLPAHALAPMHTGPSMVVTGSFSGPLGAVPRRSTRYVWIAAAVAVVAVAVPLAIFTLGGDPEEPGPVRAPAVAVPDPVGLLDTPRQKAAPPPPPASASASASAEPPKQPPVRRVPRRRW